MSGNTGTRGAVARSLAWRVLRLCLLAAIAAAAAVAYRTWPRSLAMPPASAPPVTVRGQQWTVRLPGGALVAEVATFHDELDAYLQFDYLRSRKSVQSSRVLLTAEETAAGPLYRLFLLPEPNLLTAVPQLAALESRGLISGFDLQPLSAGRLADMWRHTGVFVAAYNAPVRDKLESLTSGQLLSPLTRFLVFKSATDRRVRSGSDPLAVRLTDEQARELAADIITVGHFYDLPLDFFLGIGAMENNYMDVPGDLQHSVWKRRPQPGDIVLRRRRRRVLVSNYSIGVWQITRETLRYAHRLYLRDKRDYSLLPERLRPPRQLELDYTDPHVLTTYAGLLFRDLLDHFNGNVEDAVGAYNGGVRNPNPDYASGVQAVAQYARNILERVATLNGRAVVQSRIVAVRPSRLPPAKAADAGVPGDDPQ
jgi:hypothetical protein